MKREKLEEILDEIGSKDIALQKLEVENQYLKEQNEALIKQNLKLKAVLEEHEII
jgi:hypothetical protein